MDTEKIYEEAQRLMKKAVWRKGRCTSQKLTIRGFEHLRNGVSEEKRLAAIERLANYRADLLISLKLLKDFLNESIKESSKF